MPWNWEQPGWPDFTWDAAALTGREARFLRDTGIQIGSIRHFDEHIRTGIIVDMMTGEALDTSAIEGEVLNRDSVQSSLLRNFGLAADNRRILPTERGIAEMMTDLYLGFGKPLSHAAMHAWHRMLMQGRIDLHGIGGYRTGGDPMKVVSGYVHQPKIHFEAPPARAVPGEMDRFVAWFASTAPDGSNPLPALTRAGLAHLHFVSIHPYEDGNGRIARALAVKALAQAAGQPSLLALSHVIHGDRRSYYDALEANNKHVAITDWLVYFADTILEAQGHTQHLIDFLISKTKLYDRVRDMLNDRQARVVEHMFREGPGGFEGGLSAANYISITRAPRATATRDLQDLVEKGVLTVTGILKSTRYHLNIGDGDEDVRHP